MKGTFRIRIERLGVDYVLPLAWCTYFPFIGWLYPFVSMKDDGFAMEHGKRALVMALFFTAFPLLLTFASAFVPILNRVAALIIAIMVYLSHIVYFGLCIRGFLLLRRKARWEVPLIDRFAEKIHV